jgi:chorismate-pyruvate lyase
MTAPNFLALSQRRMPNKQMLPGLSRFQRLFLVTDGTVTEILEQYLEEKIKVQKLQEGIEYNYHNTFPQHRVCLDDSKLPVMQRRVLLQGQSTLTNWVYAESSIVLDHLIPEFRNDLLVSREPIGCLWEKYEIETFKSILDVAQYPADALADHFGIQPQEAVISRTYRVNSGGKLLMVITETFPARFFQD